MSKRKFDDVASNDVFEYIGTPSRVPKDVVSLRFHSSVKVLPGYAFYDGFSQLQEVVLNEGLLWTGGYAFAGCKSLQSITFPSTIKDIDCHGFNSCTRLRTVVFNDNEALRRIGSYVFAHCLSLESISLPSTLTKIDKGTFMSCINLREVTLQEGLQTIGDCAFKGCTSLESITIPSTVNRIGDVAFNGCSRLREVTLHEGIQTISHNSFHACSSLQRFKFPSISTRLNNIVKTGHYPRAENITDNTSSAIEWRGSEMYVPAVVVIRSRWNTVKREIDYIVKVIRYYEVIEATSLFELALWKAKLNQEEEPQPINREACRIEVPGPVKDAILQYL